AERMREEAAILARAVSVFRLEATNGERPVEFDVTPAAPQDPVSSPALPGGAKKRVPQLSE
ncbi:MAG: hypothetical protein ACREH4_01065, partial [Vitreimonas sp.]